MLAAPCCITATFAASHFIKQMKKKTIKYSKEREENTKLTKINVSWHCGYLDKDFSSEVEDMDFYSSESECDLCGSHGSTTVEVKCECGNSHTLTIRSW